METRALLGRLEDLHTQFCVTLDEFMPTRPASVSRVLNNLTDLIAVLRLEAEEETADVPSTAHASGEGGA